MESRRILNSGVFNLNFKILDTINQWHGKKFIMVGDALHLTLSENYNSGTQKDNIKAYKGILISKSGNLIFSDSTITLRGICGRIGFERSFLLNSPRY